MNTTTPETKSTERLAVIAWIRLARAYHKIERAMTEHLRHWQLSTAQFDLIAQLGQSEGITQQELADRLLVTKGNICQLLNRLETSGLITREPDGRANRLFLTEAGRALFHEVVPAEEAVLAARFATLSHEEQSQLLRLLRKLDHTLE